MIADLKAAAARVRKFWRDIPPGTRIVPTLSADGEELLRMIEALPADAAIVSRTEANEVIAAFLHNVPAEGGDELERTARYSNGTVQRVGRAIDDLLRRGPR